LIRSRGDPSHVEQQVEDSLGSVVVVHEGDIGAWIVHDDLDLEYGK
jgi:hypothetical protein